MNLSYHMITEAETRSHNMRPRDAGRWTVFEGSKAVAVCTSEQEAKELINRVKERAEREH